MVVMMFKIRAGRKSAGTDFVCQKSQNAKAPTLVVRRTANLSVIGSSRSGPG